MIDPQDSDYIWVVVVGFILAFVLAFGIGANDVANSFGTSVGSKVLTLRQACIIASIFEVAGAVLIGARVSDTVRKGIIDINSFNGTEELAMVGSLSALTGTSVWLLVATFFNLPVSGTHSVVGATMGFALVAHGLDGVKWKTFGKIAGSWVISPLLSGFISSLIFVFVNFLILKKIDSFSRGVKFLPLFYAVTIAINLFSVFYKGSHMLHFNKIPLYGVLILTIGGGILTAIAVHFVLGPYLQRKIIREMAAEDENSVTCSPTSDPEERFDVELHLDKDKKKNGKDGNKNKDELNGDTIHLDVNNKDTTVISNATIATLSPLDEKELISDPDSPEKHDDEPHLGDVRLRSYSMGMQVLETKVHDDPMTGRLFAFLQIMTACFGAFAHGGNDVSNCIGPLIALWTTFRDGGIQPKVDIPIWILLYGGVGISIGLWVWGRRVIKTVGEDLTPITPTSGFTIEIGSAITVLLASNLGIPISTTHCKVGSVVMVGRVRSKEHVDWSIFRNVVLAWIVTMPVAGALSAVSYVGLRELV
ncbi:sodium-dependent phosphate transporter 1-B [Exaiptasia diaphana]|uniref:Phosphate transporter n=1 Tax=Exaiptasia diaphana TaxID=2652724 RepID=A0A913XG33_EXADI|nr:sodium-dependent phosphate transporter 1-B [Exaiptasia diaphana]XP_028515835.1 sodium-dependent phosphate transporter 1-B [Exaiptasia diaphana]